jgi:predicted CopG family antitoxin
MESRYFRNIGVVVGMKKIKLESELYNRAKQFAETAGYSSVEEFIAHLVEKELFKIETENDSVEEVEKRLRGLGYIE